MTLRERALAARESQERHRAARQERESDDAAARLAQRVEEADGWIAESGLLDWFPGERWDHMSYSRKGSAADYGGGVVVAPQDRSVLLLVQPERHPDAPQTPAVYAVEHLTDSDTGYGYYSGPRVSGPADVGRWIAQLEDRK